MENNVMASSQIKLNYPNPKSSPCQFRRQQDNDASPPHVCDSSIESELRPATSGLPCVQRGHWPPELGVYRREDDDCHTCRDTKAWSQLPISTDSTDCVGHANQLTTSPAHADGSSSQYFSTDCVGHSTQLTTSPANAAGTSLQYILLTASAMRPS